MAWLFAPQRNTSDLPRIPDPIEVRNINARNIEDPNEQPQTVLMDDIQSGNILVNIMNPDGVSDYQRKQYYKPEEITGLLTRPRQHPLTRRPLRTADYRYYRVGRILRRPAPAPAAAPAQPKMSFVYFEPTAVAGVFTKRVILETNSGPDPTTETFETIKRTFTTAINDIIHGGRIREEHRNLCVLLFSNGLNFTVIPECPHEGPIHIYNALNFSGNTLKLYKGINTADTFTVAEIKRYDTARVNYNILTKIGQITQDDMNQNCAQILDRRFAQAEANAAYAGQLVAEGGRIIKRKSKTKRRVKSFNRRK